MQRACLSQNGPQVGSRRRVRPMSRTSAQGRTCFQLAPAPHARACPPATPPVPAPRFRDAQCSQDLPWDDALRATFGPADGFYVAKFIDVLDQTRVRSRPRNPSVRARPARSAPDEAPPRGGVRARPTRGPDGQPGGGFPRTVVSVPRVLSVSVSPILFVCLPGASLPQDGPPGRLVAFWWPLGRSLADREPDAPARGPMGGCGVSARRPHVGRHPRGRPRRRFGVAVGLDAGRSGFGR